jgi:tetratricopeptide (TPR) repeat protein
MSSNKENGVTKTVLQSGSGPVPSAGWSVAIRYTGYLTSGASKGVVFDASADRGDGLQHLTLGGRSALMPALADTITSMRVGEKAEVLVPPELAFGAAGLPNGDPAVPPHETLRFELELVSASPPPTATANSQQPSNDQATDERFANAFGIDFVAEAAKHKEDGNKKLVKGDARNAVAAYEQALACLENAEQVNEKDAENRREEITALRIALHSNCAQAQLKLSSFEAALQSAESVLALQSDHEKGLFRRAKALQGLRCYSEAEQAVKAMLETYPQSKDAHALLLELQQLHAGSGGGSSSANVSAAATPALASVVAPVTATASVASSSSSAAAATAQPKRRRSKSPDDFLAAAAAKAFGGAAGSGSGSGSGGGGSGGGGSKGVGLYADAPNYERPIITDVSAPAYSTDTFAGKAGAFVGSLMGAAMTPLSYCFRVCCIRRNKGQRQEAGGAAAKAKGKAAKAKDE